jgi:hypothetical protein
MIRRTRLRRSTKPLRFRRPSKAEAECRQLMEIRSAGLCEVQVPGTCTRRAVLCGHRKRRSQSSKAEKWSATNVLHDCPPCERYLTDHGSDARVRSYGWTVHPCADTSATPVFRNGVWVWLTETGGFQLLTPREIQEWEKAA